MEGNENKPQIQRISRAKTAKRLSAAHLSDNVRGRIVSLMQFHESAEAAASAACREFPGLRISGRLVLEVMVLCIPRKPPVSEIAFAVGQRRSA